MAWLVIFAAWVPAWVPARALAADDPGLRYRSGMQVAEAAYVGAAVGLALTVSGDVVYGDPAQPPWVSGSLTTVGLMGLSFSTSMVGAGTLSAADALHSAGCPTNVAPGVAAQAIGYVFTGVDVVAAVASAVRSHESPFVWKVAETSQYVGLAGTGVRLALSGVQAGLDAGAARGCAGLAGPGSVAVAGAARAGTPTAGTPTVGTPSVGTPSVGTPSVGTPARPSLAVVPWAGPGGFGVRVVVSRW